MTASPDEATGAPIELDAVLDVAADAYVNDGLDALSLRHIASRLGVEPGAVVALVGSVEQLIVSMLTREYDGMFRAIVDNIERDPLGGRLSRIYRYVLSAVYERPLARTLYLTSREEIDRIMRTTHGFAYVPRFDVSAVFIDRMKEAGVVRRDIDSAGVSAVISSVSAGAALQPPDAELDDIITGLGTLLERSADTDLGDTSAGKRVFLEYAASVAEEVAGTDDSG